MAAPLTQPLWAVAVPPIQHLWGMAPPLTQPPWAGLGNLSPGVPGDAIPGRDAAGPSALPLPELEFSLDYIPARDTRDTSRESQNHCPSAEHCNITAITALPTSLPDPVWVWQKVKQLTIASVDYEGAELIDVPMSGGWKPQHRTVAVYAVIRGNRTTPDKYTHFQWPVLSELHQLVAKHGLGSTAVANMLQFQTPEESSGDAQSPKPKVMVKDIITNKREGPLDLITWGCGYACASMEHDGYPPGMFALLYVLLGTRDIFLMKLQQMSWSSESNDFCN
ncbi:hypothetical protein DUI87_02527 [Hirundo rustica rustica]|uniref:Uncharacterized protein n=1 Tax=Hirundo rustica rustica TaxID=333673 RepID=A0A3M0L813_HIRRU|nr:hypothetical protein DUI87_02527 [Hirundo rustica rustica]